MNTYKTNKEKMGYLAEQLVFEYFKGTQSIDKYDSKKDGMIGNETAEVKCQNRHPYGYFTVNSAWKNQVPKCKTVDRLFFVEYDNSPDAMLWECIDRNNTKEIITRDGRKMVAWPISKMKLITTFEGKGDDLREYTSSKIF
tara:strand:+ start:249 stop:671 length:423 start_codon:yes stop_codon:yes gene_type:complete